MYTLVIDYKQNSIYTSNGVYSYKLEWNNFTSDVIVKNIGDCIE